MIDLTFNGKDLSFNSKNLAYIDGPVDPYNPYNLGPGVVRLTFYDADDYDPNTDVGGPGIGHWERVSGNTWDFYPEYLGLDAKFFGLDQPFDLESWNLRDYSDQVLASFRGSNIVNINNPIDFSVAPIDGLYEMFAQSHVVHVCPGIRLQPNRSAEHMFRNCQTLVEIPIFDWDYVPGQIYEMFANDRNVMYGMTRLYDNWSTIEYHDACFRDCGVNTTTGAAELAQLPSSWGGTMA